MSRTGAPPTARRCRSGPARLARATQRSTSPSRQTSTSSWLARLSASTSRVGASPAGARYVLLIAHVILISEQPPHRPRCGCARPAMLIKCGTSPLNLLTNYSTLLYLDLDYLISSKTLYIYLDNFADSPPVVTVLFFLGTFIMTIYHTYLEGVTIL